MRCAGSRDVGVGCWTGWLTVFVGVLVDAVFGAAPQLASQPETIGGLKVRVLNGSKFIPKATLVGHGYTVKRGEEVKHVKWYAPADIWRDREEIGTWKDKKGNVMQLAQVDALMPAFKREHWDRAEIESALEESAKSFKGTDDEFAEWKRNWGGDGKGRFFEAKNGKRYYVDFTFAVPVKDGEREKLLKTFVDGVKVSSGAQSGGGTGSVKWWTLENPQYRFMSDLSKSQGGAFVKTAMKLMSAMRKAYEGFVPPQKQVGVSTVRVFKTQVGYREYRTSTGDNDTTSIGLWDPSREELLISAECDREKAQETMRHEAFHQYLYYATGRGDHAMWFNEGHACFFEHVQYNPAKDVVKVIDKGSHAVWVERDPGQVARRLASVMALDRDSFYNPLIARVTVGDYTLNASYYNYVTAWALVYFLEKGAYAHDDFAPYRKVIPTYLDAMAKGLKWDQATEQAWKTVANRDLAADFLKFWDKFRNAARNAR